jgi:GT2 family glycosyltransferase
MVRRIRRRQPDFPSFSTEFPSVSVVLVTYGKAASYLEPCLASLRALDYPNFDVVIVDNASTDGAPELLRRLCRDEKILLLDHNAGFAGGCNIGVRESSGELVVLLNFDTELRPDWLRRLIRPLVENSRIAICGCKMLYPGGKIIQHAGGILNGNGMSEHIGHREPDNGQHDRAGDVDYVTGAGMAIRREFLELCGGGLDEDFYPAYYEEADLCYRAHLMGYLVWYEPSAVLIHHESPALTHRSPAFNRLQYRNRMIFCLKNYRLRDWLFKFIPYEIHWLRAPWSKGLRRVQLRAYLDGLVFLLGRRYSPERPFPLE